LSLAWRQPLATTLSTGGLHWQIRERGWTVSATSLARTCIYTALQYQVYSRRYRIYPCHPVKPLARRCPLLCTKALVKRCRRFNSRGHRHSVQGYFPISLLRHESLRRNNSQVANSSKIYSGRRFSTYCCRRLYCKVCFGPSSGNATFVKCPLITFSWTLSRLRCEILSKVRRDRWQLPLGRDTEQLVNKFPLSHHVTLS